MKKAITFLSIFVLSLVTSVAFQNCGNSSLKSNRSTGGETIQVPIPGDNSSNDTSEDTDDDSSDDSGNNGRVFNLELGDNILYLRGGGLSLDLDTSRILAKSFGNQAVDVYQDTIVYEQGGVLLGDETRFKAYCQNSALPHCRHLNDYTCQGAGCFDAHRPVRCHWQNRLSNSEINNLFSAINSLTYTRRLVDPSDPQISDCNGPHIWFNSSNDSLKVSLGARECVPDSTFYAINGSDQAIESVFNTEINGVRNLMNLDENSDFCNNYSSYYWNTTKFTYSSLSGFVPQGMSYSYQASYEGQYVDLKFKEPGSDRELCANNVPVQPADLEVLFPATGLKYDVLRTNAAIADAPTALLTYEDPIDGGDKWQLYLDEASAMTFMGGAFLDSDQAAAIKNVIENILVNRAKNSGMASAENCQ